MPRVAGFLLAVLTLAGCTQVEGPVAPKDMALASPASANANLVTGETGRFANASGSATRIGSTNFSDGSGTWEIQGTLTYDASDRR